MMHSNNCTSHRQKRYQWRWMFLLQLLPYLVTSTVVLPEYNRSFPSMPAIFGDQLSPDGEPVKAHMMVFKDLPLMCQEDVDEYDLLHTDERNVTMGITIQPADDGLPVALLVQRGKCTFYEKAIVASKWKEIKYLIVYDDEVNQDLVPMSSEYPVNMTLFFVSYLSGTDMRDLILRKMTGGDIDDPVSPGILVELDAVSPTSQPPLPELNVAAYFLAAMSGFLAFLIFFGCLLICAQMGCITAQPDERGRIVLFAGGQGARQLAVRIIRNNLLTEDQVMALDEEEFQISDGHEEEEACTCAICLEEFEDKEKVRVLPCKHRFHEACLLPWLTERHSSCPLCKFDVMQHILDNQGNGTGENKQDRVPPPSPAATENSNSSVVDNFRNEGPVSAPVSVWYRRWGFRGWSGATEGHQHLILDNVSSSDDEEMQSNGIRNINNNTQGSAIAEIEMERRTPSSSASSAPVGDGTLQP